MSAEMIMDAEELRQFEEYAQAVALAVEEELDAILPKPAESDDARLFEAMRYSVFAGGKRVRPLLILAANNIFGGNKKRAIRVAAAMECLHTYSLVHDDLPSMDDDDLRRGKPTCHKQFDEGTALLAGDALQTFAFEILSSSETHPNPAVCAKLVQSFAQASGPMGMCGGQMIDLIAETKDADTYDQGALARLQRKKTGALFAACTEAALIMNSTNTSDWNRLTTYAKNVGLAFQMVDDILDETGDAEKMGKAVNKDRGRGKATFARILGVDGARRQAEFLATQAIDQISVYGERADILKSLARFVVSRSY